MATSLKDIQNNQPGPKGSKPENQKNGQSAIARLLATEIGGGKLNDSFKESFYRELALLLEAGMNIKSALDLMRDQQKKVKHKELLEEIGRKLTQGGRFSEILESRKEFTAYEHFSIRIGEETGNLVEILKRLSSFYEQKIQQRRAIIGTLTYPMVITGTAVLAVTFMLTYMVPLFKDIFSRMGGELPWLTKLIIDVSNGFGGIIGTGLLLITGFIIVHLLYRQRDAYKKIQYGLLLRIPVIGSMLRQTYILRLVQSLSLLISSRVPITSALDLSEKMVRFYPISNSLKQVQKDILAGKTLNQGLTRFPIYDSRFVALVKVGEESNQLSLIFSKMAEQMEEELQHRAKMLGNILEPLIIVFLGFFVAVILVAMYLPMFKLSTSIGF